MEIDLPEVVAEVRAEFDRYEKALGDNGVAALNAIFWKDPRTIRYGGPRISMATTKSKRFASPARRPASRARSRRPSISTYGRDHAVASTLFHRASVPGKVGRQMQTWVRFPQGWRVVAAHVSFIDEPK